jgi:hypothetical protein
MQLFKNKVTEIGETLQCIGTRYDALLELLSDFENNRIKEIPTKVSCYKTSILFGSDSIDSAFNAVKMRVWKIENFMGARNINLLADDLEKFNSEIGSQLSSK